MSRDEMLFYDGPDKKPRNYPRTADEWWRLFDYHTANLRNLVAEFHPAYARWARRMPITAADAEAACEKFREEIERETADDPLECFDQFALQRSPGVVALLNQTWFGVPESADAHSLPGFGVLCDLCSESYRVEGDEDQE